MLAQGTKLKEDTMGLNFFWLVPSERGLYYALHTNVWPIENNKNLNSIFCLIKSSKTDFIFLPAFDLIMWLMTSSKNFEKISILKIWEAFFFWGGKTHFGEKKAWFVIEILIHGSKNCLLWMSWSPQMIKLSFIYNTDHIKWEW